MFKNQSKPTLTVLATFFAVATHAQANLEVNIGYLQQQMDNGPVLSNIIPDPEDSGLKGAELGINDNNTTGRFLKHKYSLQQFDSENPEELISKASDLYAQGVRFFVIHAQSQTLKDIDKALPDEAVIFNSGSPSDQLRSKECNNSLLHTLPSRAMLTDALAQWLKAKRLNKVLVISGQKVEDKAYTQAFKRAAKRFGLKIVAEKQWDYDTDLRRTAQSEMPLFTQTKEYDVVFVADERGDFGEYVLYNTWLPRPVVGTQGLSPVTWHRVVEQWGAAQLQSRFDKLAKRWMTNEDYASWAAVRSVGEAVTRTNSSDPKVAYEYIRSEKFELAGFKGRKLNYREWNGQLRQPIPLVHPRSLVSQSPQDGFLHPVNELDTLGFDKSEVKCSN
ncbi:ABC transporter substrate-binding protein [Neptuniibacter sp. QD72_48]|uniref:ABC transporter substrate-binding protein n=1 Tax=Neptuniibacter sp. QD72_48 TaxID=3398214 RepID=UPI0039F53E81